MAKAIGDNYSYGGAKPNFERDTFDSVTNMEAYALEGKLDVGHICYITGEGKHYMWNGTDAQSFEAGIFLGSALTRGEDGKVDVLLNPETSGLHKDNEGLHIKLASAFDPNRNAMNSPLRLEPTDDGTYGLGIRLSSEFYADNYGLRINPQGFAVLNLIQSDGSHQSPIKISPGPYGINLGLQLSTIAGLELKAYSDVYGLGIALPVSTAVTDGVMLPAWSGSPDRAAAIPFAGGGLLLSKEGLSLYLDTNYFEEADQSLYGGGAAPITLKIEAIAKAVAQVMNS